MAALGKVSEGPHSSTDCQFLDLQVAGLQGCANTLGPKNWWRGRESNPGLLLLQALQKPDMVILYNISKIFAYLCLDGFLSILCNFDLNLMIFPFYMHFSGNM